MKSEINSRIKIEDEIKGISEKKLNREQKQIIKGVLYKYRLVKRDFEGIVKDEEVKQFIKMVDSIKKIERGKNSENGS